MKEKRFCSWLAAFALGLLLSGCQSQTKPLAVAATAPSAHAPSPSRASVKPLPSDSVPAIARREVIRRQESIRQMDEAALRASQAMANDDLEGAVIGYRRAVGGLP